MDGSRQASSSASPRRAHRQGGARRRQGDRVITHPEKILFPDDGITKGELASYYESIAPIMLPHISRRPITMERYPSGIGRKGFWQKDVSRGFPSWLEPDGGPEKEGIVPPSPGTRHRAPPWGADPNNNNQHAW